MIAKCPLPCLLRILILALLTASSAQAQVNPTLLSSVPAIGATNVAPDTSVVFTFSKSMDTNKTSALFIDPAPIATVETWTSNTTVLTVTFPLGLATEKTIVWKITGADLVGNPFQEKLGSFQTGTGTEPTGLLLSAPVLNGSTISIEVLNTIDGQAITLETSSTLQPGSWVKKETKTATGSTVSFTDTIQTGKSLLYRARTGS